MAPSLIILTSEVLLISPSVTFEPATFPAPETLNIYKICAVPVIFSCTSGANNPDILCLM